MWRTVLMLGAALFSCVAVFGLTAYQAHNEAAVHRLRESLSDSGVIPRADVPSQAESLDAAAPGQREVPEPADDHSSDHWRSVFEGLPGREATQVLFDMEVGDRTPEVLERARAFLAEHAEAVDAARELLHRGTAFPQWEAYDEEVMQALDAMRTLARILSMKAMLAVHEGDTDAAVDQVLYILRAGELMRTAREPLFHIVSSTSDGMGLYILVNEFAPGGLRADQVQRIVAVLNAIDHRHALMESLKVGADRDLATFSDVRGGTNLWHDSPRMLDRLGGFVVASPLYRPWLNRDEAEYAELKMRLLELASRPYYEVHAELERIYADVEGNAGLAPWFLGSQPYPFRISARHEVSTDLTRLGLLIEQHFAEHGTYPESLHPLAPALGGAVPVDPFSGEAYRYAVSDDGFTLYSIGTNMHDDGGRHDLREGDIVWRGDQE